MPAFRAIPRSIQRDEPWANGAGTTTVILRDPDDSDWTVRISVARVDSDGPFSELPGTRRLLVPLDAPMRLRLADGRELHGRRFSQLAFDGAPAPVAILPEGPTRDFNLMLRAGARGQVLPRTLVDSMLIPRRPDERWLVYLDSGRATLRQPGAEDHVLAPGDAALLPSGPDGAGHPVVQGAGEIILVRLYA